MFKSSLRIRTSRSLPPRPSDLWIDITAQDTDGEHRYSITIPEIVPGQPVPLVQCRINNWPDVSKANIDVWLRIDDSEAEQQQLPIADGSPTTFAGAKIRVNRDSREHPDGNYHVVVTESYDDPSKLNSIRVLPDPLPEKAMIEVFRPRKTDTSDSPPSNVVKRTFRYQEKPDQLDLWVSEKRQITKDAIYARGELRVQLDQ